MKVGLITSVPLNPPWDQGDKNLAYALTQALPDIQFSVLTARQEPEPMGGNLLRLPLFQNRLPSLKQKAYIYWWYLRKSFYARQNNDVDLYHMSYQPVGFSSRLLKLLPEFQRVPSIHTVPATATSHILSASFLFADRIIALSEYGRQKLIGLGLKNVYHVPVGIDASAWENSNERTVHSKAEMSMEGRRVILFPGHYHERYGVDSLVRAMPLIHKTYPDTLFIFACRMRTAEDWTGEKKVQSEVKRLGLEEAVKYMHTIEDMKSIITASDIVVMPFRSMKDKIDIPTTLLEAMAAGKPFVISDIPPMNELVHVDGKQAGAENVGSVHKPGDAQGLAESVMNIIADEALYSAMSVNGVELAKKCFDISEIAEQYREHYSELIG